jgi:hypothetical protein
LVNVMHTFLLKRISVSLIAITGFLFVNFGFAVPITISVDTNNPENDVVADLNLARLLPIAEGSEWTYILDNNNNPREVIANIGAPETIGGGCLRVRPMVFGAELALYLGNYEDSLSLHGIYLKRWKGLEDVVLKFETRNRVEWLDFRNRFISEAETPIDENSCQDTERGLTERKGFVLMEDLTQQLGIAGSGRGDIICRVKNTDLRENIQTGSGTAVVKGVDKTLRWRIDSLVITPNGNNEVNIAAVFNPKIHSSQENYSIYLDITLEAGKGITQLSVTDGDLNDDIHDLQYTLGDSDLVSNTNLVVPGGSCPEDGRIDLMFLFIFLGLFLMRSFDIMLLRRE